MKKYFPFELCLVSLVTALTFAFSGIGLAEVSYGNSAPTNLSSSERVFYIPAKFGRLESFHQGKADKAIIHIQTARGKYEAQKQIESILKQLEKTHGIMMVLAEGSWEPLPSELLRYFPENLKLTNKLNGALARKGVLQGVELYLIGSKNAKGYGIEDEKSYLQSVSDFADLVKALEASGQFMLAAVDGIEEIASAYLRREPRNFLRLEEHSCNGQFALGDWMSELKQQVQVNYGEDLSDAGFQVEWSMLFRCFYIQKMEGVIDAMRSVVMDNWILQELQH